MKFNLGFYLLLVFFISTNSSYTLEQVVNESVETGLKSLTQLKRQLPDDMDDDSRELIGNMDRDYTTRDEVSNLLPTPVRRAAVVNKKPNITKIENHNCSCKVHKETQAAPEFTKHPVDRFTFDDSEESSDTTIYEHSLHPTPASISISKAQLNETHFELQELEFQLHAAMKEVCPHFKDIPDLDIESMADVWQLSYILADYTLSCFKIVLKKTSLQCRKRNKVKYTSFNDSIDWHECYLELTSTGKQTDNRKHFLQGSKSDKGVLENIVLSQSTNNDSKTITLLDQTPDQWLVTKNLLLMRDCARGDVVIFTRVPSKPDKKELVEAMTKFGENGMNDTKPCKPYDEHDKVKNEEEIIKISKYYTLS